jgi:hypothetical protein
LLSDSLLKERKIKKKRKDFTLCKYLTYENTYKIYQYIEKTERDI